MAKNLGSGVYIDSFSYQDVNDGHTINCDILIDSNTGAVITGNIDDGYIISVKSQEYGNVTTHGILKSKGHPITDYTYLLNDGFQDSKEYNWPLWLSPESSYGRNNELEPISHLYNTTKTVNIDGKNVDICVGGEAWDNNSAIQYINYINGEINSEDAGGETTTPDTTNSKLPYSDAFNISVDSILNGTYAIDENILYEKKIDLETVISNLSYFCSSTKLKADSLVNLYASIDEILKATNSERFYSGDTATTHLGTLKDTSNDANAVLGLLNNDIVADVKSIISEYNPKLVEAKHKVRKQLLLDKIAEINALNEKVIIDGCSGEPIECTSDFIEDIPQSSTSYIDNVYKVVNNTSSITEVSPNSYKYSQTKTCYINIKTEGANVAQLESRILKVGKTLPYDKNQIVDYN